MRREKRKSLIFIFLGSTMVMLAFFGSKTMPMRSETTAYKETASPLTTIIESSSSTSILEESTTVPETTTTTEAAVIVRTTPTTRKSVSTTEPYVVSTVPQSHFTGSNGPLRNITTLVGCIAYYESSWGDISSNIFQFEQGTWETYGGIGFPGNATYSYQENIFWLAWKDDGHHHWAAQKGRCF